LEEFLIIPLNYHIDTQGIVDKLYLPTDIDCANHIVIKIMLDTNREVG